MPATPGGIEIGTVYVAAPDGPTPNCPDSAPRNRSPTVGSAARGGSTGGLVYGVRSGLQSSGCGESSRQTPERHDRDGQLPGALQDAPSARPAQENVLKTILVVKHPGTEQVSGMLEE